MKKLNKKITPEQLAYSNLLSYGGMLYPKYRAEPMHELIATALEAVEAGVIRRLLIFAPPQHGKCCEENTLIYKTDGTTQTARDIKVGTAVLGYHKGRITHQTILAKEYTKKHSIKLTTKTGRFIIISTDHRMLTSTGYKEASNITKKDFLLSICKEVESNKQDTNKQEQHFIYDRITKIEYVGEQNLVHLQTSGTQTFIANGLVSHNTMLTSEFFPPWAIGRNPHWKIIAATFNQTRANEIGGVVRNYLTSDIQKRVFPDCHISPDTKSVHHIATTQRGHYYSIGVSGTGTGRGANCFLIDDPFKGREDAESKVAREKVKEWYKAVAYTRLRPDNRIIIINTRWHLDDLSGFVLREHAHENWKVLDLKAVAEEGDILKRNVGEALCPSMYPREKLDIIKEVEGTYNWESLYQQRPIAREGGMIKYEWIKHYSKPPEEEDIIKTVISWDTAYKAEQLNDPTAATVWAITRNAYYLLDVVNKRMEYPDLLRKVEALHNIYQPSGHLIEGRASGQSLIQDLRRNTGIPVIEISTKNIEKEIRFDSITTLFESGRIFFPEKAHWLSETEDQVCLFPSYAFDDIADSISQFLNWANKPRYVRRPRSALYWK